MKLRGDANANASKTPSNSYNYIHVLIYSILVCGGRCCVSWAQNYKDVTSVLIEPSPPSWAWFPLLGLGPNFISNCPYNPVVLLLVDLFQHDGGTLPINITEHKPCATVVLIVEFSIVFTFVDPCCNSYFYWICASFYSHVVIVIEFL